MHRYSDIRHVHLEISSRCNAACPACPRNLCGVNVIDDYPLHDMSLGEAQTIFSPEFLQQLEVVQINGNLGDFVTARDGVDIVRYFRTQNPELKIDISTNAGVASDIWADLADLAVEVKFCIDGLEGTHEIYRRQTRWSTVIENARQFISAGGRATWKMIQFDFNQDQIVDCRILAAQMGFRRFELVDHGRSSFPVFDQRGQFVRTVGDSDQPQNFAEIQQIREDGKYNPAPSTLEPQSIDCQSVKNRSVYITATGEVYPCCWLGFYPRSMYYLGNREIAKLLPDNNNALDTGIEQAINWFNQVESSWAGNQLRACAVNCSK